MNTVVLLDHVADRLRTLGQTCVHHIELDTVDDSRRSETTATVYLDCD